MIKYKTVSKWAYIKKILPDVFDDQILVSALQIQLNSIRMHNDEDVNDYC